MSSEFSNLREWIDWSGSPLTQEELEPLQACLLPKQLLEFLLQCNSAIAFGGGLRLFGLDNSRLPSIVDWNSDEGWRRFYGDMADGLYSIGEDCLGNQFVINGSGKVFRFLAETGDRDLVGLSIEEWLQRLADSAEEDLCLRIVREWTAKHGPLDPMKHLCPKIPFVAGGLSTIDALYPLDRVASLQFKGDFASQIRGLPSGAKIRIRVVD